MFLCGPTDLHEQATLQVVLPLGSLQMTHDALCSSLSVPCQKHTGAFVLAMNVAEAHLVDTVCVQGELQSVLLCKESGWSCLQPCFNRQL